MPKNFFNELPEADAIAGVEVYDEIGSIIKRVMNGERFIMLNAANQMLYIPAKKLFCRVF